MSRTMKVTRKTLKQLGPVARTWAIAATNPNAARKDVVAEAERLGVNPNTARTQYQAFKHGGAAGRARLKQAIDALKTARAVRSKK